MKTKNEIIAAMKDKYPTLRIGNEDDGYTDLSPVEYEAQISEWAENQFAKEAQEIELAQIEADKTALLIKLGISADEAKLLLS
jgi:hypothetical protein